MIIFNNIKITLDNKYLIIDAEVENSKYYEGIFIGKIIIDNQDTYSLNGPSNNPVYTWDAKEHRKESYIYTRNDLETTVTDDDGISVKDEDTITYYSKYVHLKLDKTDLGEIENNIFFVYILGAGTPAAGTSTAPCGYDVNTVMKAVINTYPIYNNMMSYLKLLGDTCNTPYGIIDKILLIKMLDACILSGNNLKAIEVWNKYFRNIEESININCGCNGRA